MRSAPCNRPASLLLLVITVAATAPAVCAAPQDNVPSSTAPAPPPSAAPAVQPLDVQQVVTRLEEKNRERAAALRNFEGTRVYEMHYQGFFGARQAQMVVAVKATPAGKDFTIESQSGSKFIVEHVFQKLLDSEKETATNQGRDRTALNSSNYNFTLDSVDSSGETPVYLLRVSPKTDEKYLYRGTIWVDGKDFAVTRIEAEPAKSPSVWVKKTAIHHKYQKIDQFWLPQENRTDSMIRFGGHALLSIEYKDYKITDPAPAEISAESSAVKMVSRAVAP